jgi:hypothetical protein
LNFGSLRAPDLEECDSFFLIDYSLLLQANTEVHCIIIIIFFFRAAQVPEAPLGNVEKRASQGIL